MRLDLDCQQHTYARVQHYALHSSATDNFFRLTRASVALASLAAFTVAKSIPSR